MIIKDNPLFYKAHHNYPVRWNLEIRPSIMYNKMTFFKGIILVNCMDDL